MPPRDATWADIAKTQGIAWVLLLMIVTGLGVGIREVYQGVPAILSTLEQGYSRNLDELRKISDTHVQATIANRTAIQNLAMAIRVDHVRERQFYLELFSNPEVPRDALKEAVERSNSVAAGVADEFESTVPK